MIDANNHGLCQKKTSCLHGFFMATGRAWFKFPSVTDLALLV